MDIVQAVEAFCAVTGTSRHDGSAALAAEFPCDDLSLDITPRELARFVYHWQRRTQAITRRACRPFAGDTCRLVAVNGELVP